MYRVFTQSVIQFSSPRCLSGGGGVEGVGDTSILHMARELNAHTPLAINLHRVLLPATNKPRTMQQSEFFRSFITTKQN